MKKNYKNLKILQANTLLKKILQTKGNKIFVKWRGYSNNFNS